MGPMSSELSPITDSSSSPSVLNQIVERVSDLYTLPAVALKVVELTGEPKIDCKALKECIELDPALTCKILRFVNSPIYGLSRQIADLQEALAILGTNTLKLLVLGFSLPSNLLSGIEKSMLGRYWRLSLTKGVAAREVSQQLYGDIGDEAFIGGMLQHVGMLALIQQLGPTYTNFLTRVWTEDAELQRLEVASMGFDHTILSARLLDSWSLPPSLIHAVGVSPESNRFRQSTSANHELIRSLHLADLIARMLTQANDELLSDVEDLTEVYSDQQLRSLDEVLDSIEHQVDELAELLDLELSDSTRYGEVLDRARLRLSELAAESATESLHEQGRTTDDPITEQSTRDQEITRPFQEQLRKAQAVETSTLSQTPPLTSANPTVQDYPDYDPDGDGIRQTYEGCEDSLHDPGLEGHLEVAIARCRNQRVGISLVLIEIDDYRDALLYLSAEQACQLSRVLTTVVQRMFEPEYQVIRICDSRLAIIVEGLDPDDVSSLLRQLQQGLHRWSEDRVRERNSAMTISIGLASTSVPPRNFTGDILIDRADRCLSTAQHFGGNTIKTIVF